MSENNLGLRGEDVVTSFNGLIMGFCQYYTGCDQYLIIPTGLDKDGKRQEGEWYDTSRIRVSSSPSKLTLEGELTPSRDSRPALARPGCDEAPPPGC